MINKKIMYDVAEWSLITAGANYALAIFASVDLLGMAPEMAQTVIVGLFGVSAVYLAAVKLKFIK